ncbi:hypothetical protein B0H11DRAFT_11869 [Mycena galericulata]|nr:hypothetical protein B0H11DRAFT_11869 [Mycena galericulata]
MTAADFLSLLSIYAILKKVMEVVDADLQFDVDSLQKTHLLSNRLETTDETLMFVTRRRSPTPSSAITTLMSSVSVTRRDTGWLSPRTARNGCVLRFCHDGVEDEVHSLLECAPDGDEAYNLLTRQNFLCRSSLVSSTGAVMQVTKSVSICDVLALFDTFPTYQPDTTHLVQAPRHYLIGRSECYPTTGTPFREKISSYLCRTGSRPRGRGL